MRDYCVCCKVCLDIERVYGNGVMGDVFSNLQRNRGKDESRRGSVLSNVERRRRRSRIFLLPLFKIHDPSSFQKTRVRFS